MIYTKAQLWELLTITRATMREHPNLLDSLILYSEPQHKDFLREFYKPKGWQ